MDKNMINDLVFSLYVYSDCAVFKGAIPGDTLAILAKLCKKRGLTHMTTNDDGTGFKFVKGK